MNATLDNPALSIEPGGRTVAAFPAIGADVTVKVAHSFDEVQAVMAIRAAVFIGEQDCPFAEEYDGNDWSATHVLALLGGEPVGCMRIRYFGDGARLERLCVLRRHRSFKITMAIARYAMELCRRKGMARVYGTALPEVVPLWRRLGCKPTGERVTFSGHEYVAVVGELAPHPDPIGMRSDRYVQIRPEGEWDVPGVLDPVPLDTCVA